jgi:hypothetical protein
MPNRIRLTFGDVSIDATCRDTPTARAVLDACPLSGSTQTWGEEVFVTTPVSVGEESDARAVVEPGEIAFWPGGKAIAVGFGPTPASQGDEIRLVAPTNIFADAEHDVRALAAANAGDPAKIERLD